MTLVNFSGIASGIDTNGLISAQDSATRQTREVPLQNTINSLTSTDDDLSTIKTKLTTLQTLLAGWTTASGGAVVKQVTSSNETLVSASASAAASDGTYTVTLPTNGKALNGVQSIFASTTPWTSLDAPAADGSTLTVDPNDQISITVGGETKNITLTPTTTIGDVVSTYNGEATKGIMTAVNVGTTAAPAYRLVVTSLNTGVTNGTVNITLGSDLTTNVAVTTAQAANDAQFDVAGVATGITRPTNTVTDVLPGVTMNVLNNPTSPTSVTLTVGDDVSTTTSNLQDFIDDWNDIVTFINQESTITQSSSTSTDSTGNQTTSTTNVFGPLANSSEASSTLSALRGALSSAVATSGTKVKIFADLGITTNEDGTLAFATTGADGTGNFQQALAEEPNSVNELLTKFADNLALPGGVIDGFNGFNQILDTTVNANNSQIGDLNDQISEIENNISQQDTSLRAYYANFEAQEGTLQSQQQQLTSALAGLSNG